MRNFSRLAKKPGKRQAYYMKQFKMHKAARSTLIKKISEHGGPNMSKGGARKGAVPRRGKQRKAAPGARGNNVRGGSGWDRIGR
jgi:hypothetical protein